MAKLRTIKNNEREEITEMTINNSRIHWTDNNCFEMDIGPQMLKSKIASITGYDDGFLTIRFTDRSWVTINYTNTHDNLAKEIESGLLQYKGWKRERLSSHRIKMIMNCLMEYLEETKQAMMILHTRAHWV
jgi:hypothetical protein